MSEGVNVSVETLQNLYKEITELDAVIEASVGGKSAGKRSLANRLAEEQTENVTNLSSVIEENFEGLSPEEVAGLYTGLIKKLNETFSDKVSTYLDSQIGETQEVTPEMIEAADKAMEVRKEKVKGFKTLRQLLEMFNNDTSAIPEPRKWTGSRGPRTFSQFQYAINGVDLDESDNSLATVAKMGGFEKGSRTNRKGEEVAISASAMLKDHLKESINLDLKNPPDTWEATLPNGVVVTATKQEITVDDTSYVDDSDDEDSDDED